MSCQNKLRWYELIPLFSFLGLRGRCRNCKTRISIQYPLVEFVTGLIFALLFLKFQDIFYADTLMFILTYKYYAIMFSILVVVAFYDLKHKIIPDTLSFLFSLLAFIGLFFFKNNSLYLHVPSILEFLSGFLIAFPFALFWFLSKGKWMGLGDAKLALGIGWLLPLTGAISSLAIAFWSGAIVGTSLVLFSRWSHWYSKKLSKNDRINNIEMRTEIPFAPFLVFAVIITFIFELNFFLL